MIATPLRPIVGRNWSKLSFSSTLYLKPVLDLLLVEVPQRWQPELRLGLQEALVNAAKHGNKLDPSKQVFVEFFVESQKYWWIVTDQGSGRMSPTIQDGMRREAPCCDLECGRGLYILCNIFDRVHWEPHAHQLHLYKQLQRFGMPTIL